MIWYPYEQMKTMRETDRFGIVLVVHDPWL